MTIAGSRTARATGAALVVLVVAAAVYFGLRGGGSQHGHSTPTRSPIALTASALPSASASAASATAMFGDPPSAASGQPTDTSLTTPVRARYASFNAAILPSSADGQQLTFAFFADATFTGTVRTIDRQPLFTSWSGPLDLPQSTFVITKTSDRYQVTASTTRGSFTMNLTPQGFYQLEEVDQPGVIDTSAVQASAAPTSP